MVDKLKIVIGAGEFNNNPGWLHTEKNELNLLERQNWCEQFEENTLKAILVEHVFEHLTYEEGIEAAKMCFDYLAKDGYVRCAVPDAYFRNEAYQNIVKVGGPGPKDHPAADHKIVYDYHTLTKVFTEAGFKVRLLEYCDEEGAFHQNEWDLKDGVIFRSQKKDPRNQGEELVFPSLIIDAVKH